MATIRKIEENTANLSKELARIGNRTADLEEAVEATSAKVRELGDDVSTMKSTAQRQEQSIVSLKKMKEELSCSTNKKLEVMNERIESQREQVVSFQSTVNQFKDGISEELEEKLGAKADLLKENLAGVIDTKLEEKLEVKLEEKLEVRFKQIAQASHFQSLREQAFDNRLNLVVSGLAEDEQKSTADLVLHFFESTLNIKKVEFASAFRMGPLTNDHQSYSRPILVRFRNNYHRNKVWRKRKRKASSGEGDDQKIRISADLPRELKEGVQMLYRVANAASKFEQFQSAKVFNYQLELGGRVYLPSQLEELPVEIRPSTLASPRSENTLAFFTKSSILSNHFPSEFTVEGERFYTMEQYLAVKRASFSNNPELIRKAKNARDPRQAKYVLNALKEVHHDKWYEGVEEVLLQGLRAKFTQNLPLKAFLIDTNQLLLGEASRDPRWGIGMSLDDPEVLNSSLWIPDGNLLGRCLMKIRGELAWDLPQSA